VGTAVSDRGVNSVNGAKSCNLSTCSGSADVHNTSVSSCNNNVNAGSGLYANKTDLSELFLPNFTDSTRQHPLYFIRDFDEYFSLKRTPEELMLAMVFRAVKEPCAKQWFSSVFDIMKTYDEFKKDLHGIIVVSQ
jgi:hypothetical protein